MLHVTQADGAGVTQAARDVAYLAWILGMSISVPLRSSLPLRLRARDKARAGHLSKITDPSGIQIPARRPQSDGSPVARAHVMRIAMQGQQLCCSHKVRVPRTVP